jgi:TonB family protein
MTSGVDVALVQPDTASSVQSQQTGLAGILGTQTAQSSGQGADAQGGTPVSTADLVNILTSSGGGFDMAALASSGALSSQRPADSVAGGQRVIGSSLTAGQAIPTLASTDVQSMMVFSDAASGGQAAGTGELPGSSRTSEEIMGVLTEKRGSITYIYNKHLRSDPMLMGTVVIEMVIEPSGRVSDVRVVQSDTYNPAFELELARTIETWRFGSVDEDEGSVTVQYPFSFSQ